VRALRGAGEGLLIVANQPRHPELPPGNDISCTPPWMRYMYCTVEVLYLRYTSPVGQCHYDPIFPSQHYTYLL